MKAPKAVECEACILSFVESAALRHRNPEPDVEIVVEVPPSDVARVVVSRWYHPDQASAVVPGRDEARLPGVGGWVWIRVGLGLRVSPRGAASPPACP
jgi:hypothetical protein